MTTQSPFYIDSFQSQHIQPINGFDYYVKTKNNNIIALEIFLAFLVNQKEYALCYRLPKSDTVEIVEIISGAGRFSRKYFQELLEDYTERNYTEILDTYFLAEDRTYQSLSQEKSFFESIFSKMIREDLSIKIEEHSLSFDSGTNISVNLVFKDDILSSDSFYISGED